MKRIMMASLVLVACTVQAQTNADIQNQLLYMQQQQQADAQWQRNEATKQQSHDLLMRAQENADRARQRRIESRARLEATLADIERKAGRAPK